MWASGNKGHHACHLLNHLACPCFGVYKSVFADADAESNLSVKEICKMQLSLWPLYNSEQQKFLFIVSLSLVWFFGGRVVFTSLVITELLVADDRIHLDGLSKKELVKVLSLYDVQEDQGPDFSASYYKQHSQCQERPEECQAILQEYLTGTITHHLLSIGM